MSFKNFPLNFASLESSLIIRSKSASLKVTTEFLNWAKKAGNDLITPHTEYGFPGLKEGDSWCVCATWYAKSIEEGTACPVYIKRTNEKTLQLIPIEKLKKHAIDLS